MAVIGPAGVAIHTHQIVAAFQSTKVKAAQPAIRHQSLADGPYEALIHNSGTSAKSSVNPLPPSHPKESKMVDKRTYKSFLRIYFFYHFCKDSTSYQQYKISTPTNRIFCHFLSSLYPNALGQQPPRFAKNTPGGRRNYRASAQRL